MWIIVAGLLYLSLVGVLYLKKSRSKTHKKSKKVAFFHPFWYEAPYSATMEEVAKKYYGP